ncbi:hypothetical protein EW146_g4798 [Bondarzewia mesenterica]|uniref:Uncharacterized protein n=1 Tax=Bondarzewia mesenterica TaxID=1095465 RepID=A0A4S4LTY3_9AGAM|nr:hypothetical protein EW146_g4798 [Bondarzewia mesenterica]
MPLPLSTHPFVHDAPPPLSSCASCASCPLALLVLLVLAVFCNKATACIVRCITMHHLSHLTFTKTTPFAACADIEATVAAALPNKCVQLDDIAIMLTVLPIVRGMHGDVDAMSPAPLAILMAGMAALTILLMIRGAHSNIDATMPALPAVSLMAGVAGTGLPFPSEVRKDGKVQPSDRVMKAMLQAYCTRIMTLGKATGEPDFSPLTDAMTVHVDASTIPSAALQPALEHPSEAQGAPHKHKAAPAECLKDLRTAQQKDDFIPWAKRVCALFPYMPPMPPSPASLRMDQAPPPQVMMEIPRDASLHVAISALEPIQCLLTILDGPAEGAFCSMLTTS